MVKVGIVMGSISDKPVMEECEKMLQSFNIEYEVKILSAHRTPDEAIAYARKAYDRGIKVLIAAAGGAAHLAGVLAMQMAIGFSERVGLLNTAMRKAILGVPMWALTATVLFLGINGSIASEASIIVVPSLAAAAFAAVGMHPIAGLLAGYAATNAGFTASLIPAGTDVLLSGVTDSTAKLMDPNFVVNPTCNWYFMIVSTFMLTVVGVWTNKVFIVPRLGEYKGPAAEKESDISAAEGKGLKAAGIFTLAYIALFAALTIPKNGMMRGDDGTVLNGTLIKGLVPILIIFFILVGVVYGVVAGTLKKADDVPAYMAESLTSLTGYIVLVFVIAQFIDMFAYTNLGMIIAVNSAELLQAAGFTGLPMIIFFILLCCVVNHLLMIRNRGHPR